MYGRDARFPLEAEKEGESNSLDKVMDDISKALPDEYLKDVTEK